MDPTTLLYHDDPLLFSFDAPVVAHATYGGAPSVVLARTAFYPEAGGQMADHGTLDGARVVDVQVDDAGVVHHVLEPDATPPAVGATAHGEVDRARRRLHMALHTGQHMLSRALLDVARAETVSSRLGETGCTIDVDLASIDEGAVARAEDLVNAVVDDDVAIRAYFPTPDELAALPLRRKPKVTENVRVVDVEGFDVSPCGGTHCVRTAQVGLVRVTGLERYKGRMRVAFSAGRRARVELGAHDATLRALGQSFTCGPGDVPAAIERLRRDLTDAREALGRSRSALARSTAEALLAAAPSDGERRVVAVLEQADVEFLRAVGARITAEPRSVALLAAPSTDGVAVLVARGAGASLDCGALLKRVAAAAGGRGGGRPERAEGRLPAGSDWVALLASAG